MSNFTRPQPERIKHVLVSYEEQPYRICVAIAHTDGTPYNRQGDERFPSDVLDWLRSHKYAGRLFDKHSIVWIDYEPINFHQQFANTSEHI